MHAIPLFKNQSVRDLAWACFGKNIIDDFSSVSDGVTIKSNQIALTSERLKWLEQLDREPRSLNEHLLKARSPRLGIYFESLWQYFIQEDDAYELLANNLQVNDGKKTLGEFDLLYKNRINNQYTHLELAIKFYLNSSQTDLQKKPTFNADLHYWLGPNAIDRLDKKVDKLINQQSLLADKPASQKILDQLGAFNIKKEIAIKGCLFYPPNISSIQPSNSVIKSLISKHHHHGVWMYVDDFYKHEVDELYWKKMDRQYWISPGYHDKYEKYNNVMDIKKMKDWLLDYFSTNWQPVSICSMKNDNDIYIENTRYMIVANNWPLEKPIDYGKNY